jgi:hypothetical protein
MGPRQDAADAFIEASSCDGGLQGRWIPDEDWVCYIQECLEKDCMYPAWYEYGAIYKAYISQ